MGKQLRGNNPLTHIFISSRPSMKKILFGSEIPSTQNLFEGLGRGEAPKPQQSSYDIAILYFKFRVLTSSAQTAPSSPPLAIRIDHSCFYKELSQNVVFFLVVAATVASPFS